MMTYFYDVSTALQIILSVLSMITVGTLLGCVLLVWRRYGTFGHVVTEVVILLLNVALCVLLQLDSRFVGNENSPFLRLPYALVFAFTAVSLLFSLWSLFDGFKRTNVINNTSVKEAFDNLPTGVCFFNNDGLPVLCNLAMHRFCFAVCGKDVQFIADFEECFGADFVPFGNTVKEGKIFILGDGSVYRLERRILPQRDGRVYVQFIASDITDLYKTRAELTEENVQLRHVQSNLQRLSANVVTITREEEILNTKMRIHDEMGRCLVVAQKYLVDGGNESELEGVVLSWQRAVSMLKYNNETVEEDMLSQIRKTCDFVKLQFCQSGVLPKEENSAYILTCAVRECVTNAVRYADATKLYADFSENDTSATVVVTNDGKIPDGEIVEGGGLSTLRRRVERIGGSMVVESRPQFKLTVIVPKGKDGAI